MLGIRDIVVMHMRVCLDSIIDKVLGDVPEYREFMTVNELYRSNFKLVEKYGNVAEILEIGTSRSGDPIYALRIGNGDNIVLAFGFPHPNEPVGSLTLEYLSWKLVRDKEFLKLTKSTFLIVKVADVFGAKLNEGWFKGPFSIVKYAINYYRPPGYKQVEWSFPVEYKELKWDKPIEETKALMKLIDEYKPDYIYSLHNAGFKGVYYYLSRPLPDIHPKLKELPRKLGVPLHLGEPEAPYMKKLDNAIFKMPGIKESYDFLEKYLKDKKPIEVIKHGGSSYDYALRYKPEVIEVVCEVPYIYDRLLENTNKVGVLMRDVVLCSLVRYRELVDIIKGYIEKISPYTDYNNPFYESLSEFMKRANYYIKSEEEWARKDPSLERPATIAEVFDALTVNIYWPTILRLGLLYRAIGYIINEKKELKEKLEPLRREVYNKISYYADLFSKASKYVIIPVRKLVQIQLGAILYTLLYTLHR